MQRVALIKSLVILVIAMGLIFIPIGVYPASITIIVCVLSFCFSLFIPHRVRWGSLYDDLDLSKPKWEEPISDKKPLSIVQFIVVLFLACGFANLFAGIIKNHGINITGITMISIGIGVRLGMYFFRVFERP